MYPPPAEGVFREFLLKLLLDFVGLKEADVPDPYYGGPEEFEQVLDMVEAASRGLVDHVRVHLSRVST